MNGNEASIKKILESDPSDRLALRALCDILRGQERWPEYLDTLTREVPLTGDPAEQAWLQYQVAETEELLGQTDQALQTLSAISAAPGWAGLARWKKENLLRKAGRFEELAALLGSPAPDTPQDEKNALLLEQARLQAHPLNMPDKAAGTLESLLQSVPSLMPALIGLLRLRLLQGDWPAVAEAYTRLHDISDQAQKRGLAFRVGQIYEFRIKDPEAAQKWYAAALALGEDESVLLPLLELAEARNDAASEAATLEKLISLLKDSEPELRLLWHYRLACPAGGAKDAPEKAEPHLQAMLGIHPDHHLALFTLEQVLRKSGKLADLAGICARLANLIKDNTFKFYYLSEQFRLLFDEARESAAALAAAESMLAIDGEHPEAIRAMQAILEVREEWNRLMELIDHELSRTQDPRELQGLYFWKAELAFYRLGNTAMGVECFRKTLDIPPSHFPALKGLDRLFTREKSWDSALRIIAALMKLVQDPRYKAYYQSRFALLWQEHLKRDDQAFAGFSEVLKLDAGNRRALIGLMGICRDREAWDNYLTLCQHIMAAAQDATIQHLMHLQMAWVFKEKLGNTEKAVEHLRAAASLLPDDPLAQDQLRRIFYAAGRFEEYQEAMRAMLGSVAHRGLRAAGLLRLGSIQEGSPGAASAGQKIYTDVREVEPGNQLALRAILDLCILQNDYAGYMEWAPAFLDRQSQPVQAGLLWDLGCLRGEHPEIEAQGSPEKIKADFQRLHRISPDSSLGFRGLARILLAQGDYAGLVALVEDRIARLGPDPGLRHLAAGWRMEKLADDKGAVAEYLEILTRDQKDLPAIRALQRLYEKNQNYGELIRTIMREISLRKDQKLLISLYTWIGKLYEEKFHAVEEAVKCQKVILRIAPSNLPALHELQRLYESQDRFEELKECMLMEESQTTEPARKVSLLVGSATLLDQKLNKSAEAQALLDKALALSPDRMDILEAMESIAAREQRWPDLVNAVNKRISLTGDTGLQVELYARLAGLYEEKLQNDGEAIAAYLKARGLDPDHEPTLMALERLFERSSRFEELIDVLGRRAMLTPDSASRIDFLSRIARLWQEKLGQGANSAAAWRKVLELDPANVPALEALLALYEKAGDNAGLVEMMSRLAQAVASDTSRSVDLYCRIANIQQSVFHDEAKALSSYETAMSIDQNALAPIEAALAIREMRGEWDKVVLLLSREEPLIADHDRKASLFLTMGLIYEDRLNDRDRAAVHYESALKIKPGYLDAVKPLAEIYYAAGVFEKAGPLYDVWGRNLSGEPAAKAAEVCYRQGWIAEKLEDHDTALHRYMASVAAAPDYLPSLTRASDLLFDRNMLAEAGDYYGRMLPIVRHQNDVEETLRVLLRLAEIEVRLEHADQAIVRHEEILQLRPGYYPALTTLVKLYLQKEDWTRVLATYDQIIQRAPSKLEVASGLVEKGVVLEERLHQENSALAHYQRAVEIDPANLTAYELMSKVFMRNKRWQDAVTVMEKMLKLETDKKRLIEYNFTLGRIYKEGFNDPGQARHFLEAVLDLDAVHLPSIEMIGEIYLEQKEWQKFIDLNHRLIKTLPAAEIQKTVALHVKMGEVYRDQLEDRPNAINEFQDVTRLDPQNAGAHAALAAIYMSDRTSLPMAVTEYTHLLNQDVFFVQAYRDLGKIYESQNKLDEVFCVYTSLSIIGKLETEEEMFFEANLPHVVLHSNKGIGEESRERLLVHPDERGPMRDMLVAMGDYLDKFFPPNLEKLGAKKANKMQPTSTAPLKKLLDELMLNLGLEPIDIYMIQGPHEPAVANTEPPSLIISQEWLNRFRPEEQRFLIGRALEHLQGRHALAMQFPVEDVVRTLLLLGKLFEPSVNVPGIDADEAERQMKALKRAVPRKVRKQVEDAALAFGKEGAPQDLKAWQRAMYLTANRAGLLVCNNLKAAINAIIKTDPKNKNVDLENMEDPLPLLRQSEEIKDLFLFSISDKYFRLRKNAGFAITA